MLRDGVPDLFEHEACAKVGKRQGGPLDEHDHDEREEPDDRQPKASSRLSEKGVRMRADER